VDPAAASRCRLDALEAWAHPLRGSAPPRRQQGAGGPVSAGMPSTSSSTARRSDPCRPNATSWRGPP